MRTDLKVLRVKSNLTQKELSEKIGISVGAYSLIEKGKRVGSNKTWIKIQEIFNLTGEEVWNLQNNN